VEKPLDGVLGEARKDHTNVKGQRSGDGLEDRRPDA
jgi:hypothetical protein